MAPAIEARLIGLEEGTRTVIELAAGEAFGPRNPDMVQKLAFSELRQMGDPNEEYQVGDVVQFPTPDAAAAPLPASCASLGPTGRDWARCSTSTTRSPASR